MINIVKYNFLKYLSFEKDNKNAEYTQQHKLNCIKLKKKLWGNSNYFGVKK